jgi:hypothetical protein
MIEETKINENELEDDFEEFDFDYTEVVSNINEIYGLDWDSATAEALVELHFDPDLDDSIFEFLSVFAEHQQRFGFVTDGEF